MKRTYPANIDGKIFYIDDDAYSLLSSYLEQLHQTFRGGEGDEIVSDIESRIREHFDEHMNCGTGVITISDVNNVIETMGRPEDLGEEQGDGKQETAPRPPFISFNLPAHKRLYRNMRNKVFGGVVGGLALYLNWQPNILRLVLIILTFALSPLISIWPLPLIYLIAWMIIPPALTPAQILDMNGTPRNIDTVGQAVIESQIVPPPYKENEGSFMTTVLSILGKGIMAVFGIIAFGICLCCLIVITAIIAGLFSNVLYSDSTILTNLQILEHGIQYVYAILSGTLLGAIISGSICYGAASVLFHIKGFSKGAIITIVIISAVLIILTAVLGILVFAA